MIEPGGILTRSEVADAVVVRSGGTMFEVGVVVIAWD